MVIAVHPSDPSSKPTADHYQLPDNWHSAPLTAGIKEFGLKLTYTYELMREGKLRTFKIGRRRMVTREALIECVRNAEQESNGRARSPAKKAA